MRHEFVAKSHWCDPIVEGAKDVLCCQIMQWNCKKMVRLLWWSFLTMQVTHSWARTYMRFMIMLQHTWKKERREKKRKLRFKDMTNIGCLVIYLITIVQDVTLVSWSKSHWGLFNSRFLSHFHWYCSKFIIRFYNLKHLLQLRHKWQLMHVQ